MAWSTHRRIPLLLFAALAVGIAAGGAWFERVVSRARDAETERRVAAIARLQAGAIEAWRGERLRAAAALAGTVESLTDLPALGHDGPASDAVQADLALAFAAYERERHADLVAVVDEQGRLLAGTAQRVTPAPPEALRGGAVASDVTLPGGDLGLQVTVPFQSQEPAAALVVRFEAAREVLPFLRSWPGPTTSGEILLMRRDGPDAILLLSPGSTGARLVPASLGQVTARATAGAPGVIRGKDRRGVEVIAAAQPIEGSEWVVLAQVDAAETIGTDRVLGWLVLLAAVASVLATGAAFWLWSRRDRVRALERTWSAERRARLLRDEQARLVEVVDDPVVLLDAANRIAFWNPAAARLFGHGVDDALGRDVDALLEARPADDRDALRRLREEDHVRTGLRVRRSDGAWLELEVTAIAIRHPDGAVGGHVRVCRDLSAQRREEAARLELRARLAETDRLASMGLMAASVAHEVASPASYVLSSLRFAREELERLEGAGAAPRAEAVPDGSAAAAWAELRQALADAEEGADRVRRIAGEVKTFSRANGGEGPADVARVVDSALRIANAELRHRAQVKVELPAVPPVKASAHHLGQVVLNLLVNAAHAIPPGAPERNAVRVLAREEGPEVVLSVSDTGTGVAPEAADRLFEPFFTTKPAGQGTGLGLAICKRLVAEAGGSITFESAPGQGTTFHVRLPAVRPAVAEPPAAAARVLVVDDEPAVARALARGLAERHDVQVETDPQRALARLRGGERFDLVLCDVRMPSLDGVALLERAGSAQPDLPDRWLFLTGFAGEAEEQLLRTGRPVIHKPFELAVLRALVEQELARRRS